jgi:hypothetical protein
MYKILISITFVLSLMIYIPTGAAYTIDSTPTYVYGINNIVLADGNTYDVSFEFGTWTYIFGGSFPFSTASDTENSLQLIDDALNSLSPVRAKVGNDSNTGIFLYHFNFHL